MAEATLSSADSISASDDAPSASAARADEYGGFWIRTLAYGADFSILMLGFTAVAVLSSFLGGGGMVLYVLAAWIAPIAYFVLFTSSAGQATPGKQLCGLKVEHAGTGERISILRSVGRELGKFVSAAVIGLGFLMIGFTRRKQGLHDLLATTVVVREGPARILLALVVTFAGILIPIIVAALMFGAMFAALIAMMMGGAASGMMGGGELKSMKSLPRMEQAAQRPRPAAPLAQAPAPRPAVDAPAKLETAKPEAVVAMVSRSPAPPETVTPIPVPVPVAAPKAAPEPAPVAADAAKPAAVVPRPRAPETVFIPPSPPGPAITPKFNDLMSAVVYGDADGVAELLALGKWPDKPDSQGLTPLMVAARKGDARTAQVLLTGGADPDLTSTGGFSATSIARERRDGAMLALLQQRGRR